MIGVARCTKCGVNLSKNPAGGLCYGCLGEPFPGTVTENVRMRTVSSNGKRPVPLREVHEVFTSNLYMPDLAALDVSLASAIANRSDGDPVWVVIVAPPSSGKTEILRALSGLREAHPISSLTAQTFASGMKGNARASLLHRLAQDNKTLLVLKDFTSVLTMHREARAEILSQLREIYDGGYVREFGTGETVSWEGRLGLAAGVTPVIDSHRVVASLLGERFVYVRLPQHDRAALSRRALVSRSREHEIRERLREAVVSFVDGCPRGPEITEEATEYIIASADLATWARSGVERDTYTTRDIVASPEPEAPARFAKQIAALASALQAMGHDETRALELVGRVVRDSMPPIRIRVLDVLTFEADLATPAVADRLELPTTTTLRVLEDLTALGVLYREAGQGGPGGSHRWGLSDRARELLNATRNVATPPDLPLLTSTNTSSHLPLDDISGDIGGSA